MTADGNRAVVLLFCERLSRRDFAGMAELVTRDATWWVIGRPDYAPYGGLHGAREVLQFTQGFLGTLDEFAFTVNGSIAEADRVAIEATSSGSKGTARYTNVYLMRYLLRDGKIQSIREFFDGYEIADFLTQLGVNDSDAFEGLTGAAEAIRP